MKKILFLLVFFNLFFTNIANKKFLINDEIIDQKGEILIKNGGTHSSMLISNNIDSSRNTLYSWGRNDRGQLGIGTTQNKTSPTPVDFDNDGVFNDEIILDYSLGLDFSSAVLKNNKTNNDELYLWGENKFGQLGDGTTNLKKSPSLIDIDGDGTKGNEKIVNIEAGYFSSSVVLKNSNNQNSLYTWGKNDEGQLGNGNTNIMKKPQEIDVDGDGTKGNEKIIDVSLGISHSLALLDNGNGTQTLYTWGSNYFGQLGDGTNTNKNTPTPIDLDGDGVSGNEKIIGVSLGRNFSSAIESNYDGTNTLYMWGLNNRGQLGDGTNDDKNKPTPIDVDGDGILGNEKITGLNLGSYYSGVTLDSENESNVLYMWGRNDQGQLGDGTSNDKNKPTPIDVDGNGKIGNEKIVSFSLSKRDISSYTLLLLYNETIETNINKYSLYAWGSNYSGQFGNGSIGASFKPLFINNFYVSTKAENINFFKDNFYLILISIIVSIIIIFIIHSIYTRWKYSGIFIEDYNHYD